MEPRNLHCCVVSVDGAGVLVEGPAGSGKTSLALGLVDTARSRGLAAMLVSDDQAICQNRAGRLVATAPAAIAGLAEIRGYGIARMPFVAECDVAVIGRLVADAEVERMPAHATCSLMGVELPLLLLPQRHEQQCVRLLLAWLADRRGGA